MILLLLLQETRIVIIDGWDNDQRPKNTMSIVPLSNKDAERIFRPPPDKEGLLDSLPLSVSVIRLLR